MRKHAIRVVIGILFITSFCLVSCGGGGTDANSAAPSLITSVRWYLENVAPDYRSDGATCLLNTRVYYSESLTKDQIESVSMTAPNGLRWTIPSENCDGAGSASNPFLIVPPFYNQANPSLLPLAGPWIVNMKLKNGVSSSYQLTLHEPGSTADATSQFLYTKEDWAPSANPSQYVAALSRFPSQGYTVQFSAADGGKITSTGLSTVMTAFLTTEPRAYNFFCSLFDANKGYIGSSSPKYSYVDHMGTGLITAGGELSIVPSSTTMYTSQVDLSAVKYIGFVFTDGAQYQPTSYSTIDYHSISSLVPVSGN